MRLPKAVGDQRCFRAVGAVFFREKIAPHEWGYAQRGKKLASTRAQLNRAGLCSVRSHSVAPVSDVNASKGF